jgi:hypothetical protein
MLVREGPERDGTERRDRADEHVAEPEREARNGVALLVAAKPRGPLAQASPRPEELEREERKKSGDGVDEDVRHANRRALTN